VTRVAWPWAVGVANELYRQEAAAWEAMKPWPTVSLKRGRLLEKRRRCQMCCYRQ